MAKRHPSLVSLSQDHHHGLALAIRLRQGSNALLNDGWTHDREEQARKVAKFYEDELRRHFKAEEVVVFPVVITHLPQSISLVETLIQQHREMERLVNEINQSHGELLEQNLVTLGELLDKHIRLEERNLFEAMQAQLPSHLLEKLGQEVVMSAKNG